MTPRKTNHKNAQQITDEFHKCYYNLGMEGTRTWNET